MTAIIAPTTFIPTDLMAQAPPKMHGQGRRLASVALPIAGLLFLAALTACETAGRIAETITGLDKPARCGT